MSKKKTPVESPPIQNDVSQSPIPKVENGLGDAIGFGGGIGSPFGSPFTPTVSDTTTIFRNLRWYLISNFRQVLTEAFVEIGLVKTVCMVPVDDALRGGVEIKSKLLDEDEIKQLQISVERDDDLGTVAKAGYWMRLFGGAGIMVMTDQDPETPLDLKALTMNEELEFRAVDMWELFWDKQNTDGYDPQLETESFEFYDYYAENVHKSRVMKLKGSEVPSFIRPRLRGWGTSVVEVLVRSINQYLKATDLGFEVLDEFKLDVFKMKNLVNTLLSPNGEQKVQQRVRLANWQKNYQNAMVMDSEDDFDHKQLSFAGLADTMTGIRMQVAADMRMPITKLFGTSVSAGFSTDQNDMENYNSMVESEVRSKIKFHILRILEIKCQRMFGFIPDDLEVAFKPLRELTAVDEETVKTQKFARLIQAKAAGEITTHEFREACNKGNLMDIRLDTSGDELDPDDPEVEDLVEEGSQAQKDDKAQELADSSEGANKADSRNPSLKKKPSDGKKPEPATAAKTKNSGSAGFDRVSYEADGGDRSIDTRRLSFFENPVDHGLWKRAKEAALNSYGKPNFKFSLWWYKKEGGKF